MSKEVEKETPLIRHQRLTQLVQGIGQTLAEHAEDPEFKLYPYTFKVVDSSEVNAFSLPGGPVYVNIGLIELAENEDELAAVVAHEMGHVAARHATEQMTTVELSQLILMVTLSAVGGGISPIAMEGTRLGYILGVLRYSRSMESEADRSRSQADGIGGVRPARDGDHAPAHPGRASRRARVARAIDVEPPAPGRAHPGGRGGAAQGARGPDVPPHLPPFERTKVLLVKD